MRLGVFFTPAALAGVEIVPRVVVVDVLRATSTIIEALHNGARTVFPVATTDDAVRLAQNLGRDEAVLCGERQGLPIEGFDLGNSPLEFTGDRIADKALVMSTTNGTGAFVAVADRLPSKAATASGPATEAQNRPRVLTGAFLNMGAVAGALAEHDAPAHIVCAGRVGGFSLEDAVCAGRLIQRVRDETGFELELNDAGVAAEALARHERRPLVEFLRSTAAGERLVEIGQEADLEFCARVDHYDFVPELRDRKIQ